MLTEVRMHPDAELEFHAAVAWYFQRSQRSAERFIQAFERIIESIREHPESFPSFDDEH